MTSMVKSAISDREVPGKRGSIEVVWEYNSASFKAVLTILLLMHYQLHYYLHPLSGVARQRMKVIMERVKMHIYINKIAWYIR